MTDDRRDTDHPAEEPAPWPPEPIEGEPIALPGMDQVPEKPAERREHWS